MTFIDKYDFGDVQYFKNVAKVNGHYPVDLKSILSFEDTKTACEEITQWQGYEPTQLHSLTALAQKIGVGEIYYKDEGTRFDLGSFKSLGGSYGVIKYLQKYLSTRLGKNISFSDIRDGKFDPLTTKLTMVTATAGNHGRGVAFGAKLFGCKCRIYIHAEVSEGRKTAMEELGATVIRFDGDYDASVRFCTKEAKANGWQIISDTSFDDYVEVPADIMAGYTVIGAEISDQLEGRPLPTHIFLQGGVGGMASALCAYFWEKYPDHKPQFIVIEPNRAPCLMASAKAGEMTEIQLEQETIMAGLSCGVPSKISWDILSPSIDGFLTIGDDGIPDMMRLLANPLSKDPSIVAGESAVAGLAGLMAAIKHDKNGTLLSLNQNSIVLLIGTEGATDPIIYNKIVG